MVVMKIICRKEDHAREAEREKEQAEALSNQPDHLVQCPALEMSVAARGDPRHFYLISSLGGNDTPMTCRFSVSKIIEHTYVGEMKGIKSQLYQYDRYRATVLMQLINPWQMIYSPAFSEHIY